MNILAIIPLRPNIAEACMYIIIGFLLVCVVLQVLAFVTSIVGFVLTKISKGGDVSKAVSSKSAVVGTKEVETVKVVPQDVDPKIVAVISAACSFMLQGSKYRVVSITPATPDTNWSRQARTRIFQSHTIKK